MKYTLKISNNCSYSGCENRATLTILICGDVKQASNIKVVGMYDPKMKTIHIK